MQTDFNTPGQYEPGSNGNKELLPIHQIRLRLFSIVPRELFGVGVSPLIKSTVSVLLHINLW